MTDDKFTEIQLDFIEYCHLNSVNIGNKKLFLIHQRAFFSGVIKGINKYEEVNLNELLQKAKANMSMFDVKEFNQLILEHTNSIAQVKIHLLNIRRNERRRNKS